MTRVDGGVVYWLRKQGAIVIPKDENGEWPEWVYDAWPIPVSETVDSPGFILNALATNQPGVRDQ
jgi:hypothetical protein